MRYFNDVKGFGFIRRQSGEEIYFSRKAILGATKVQEGATVKFKVTAKNIEAAPEQLRPPLTPQTIAPARKKYQGGSAVGPDIFGAWTARERQDAERKGIAVYVQSESEGKTI